MAKNKDNSNTVEAIDNAEGVEAAGASTVTFEDGVRDFGKKGQIQKEVSFTETGIDIVLYLVTGIVQKFTFLKTNPLYDLMAGRGVIEYIGNSIAGVYQDKEGTHPEDFNLGIEQAIKNLLAGSIPVRTRTSDKATKGLGDLIRAYVELRSAAVDAEGNPQFAPEQTTYEFIKDMILASDEDTNKARLAQTVVKAKIEQYKLERQIARADSAKAKVTSGIDGLI